jgi:hypothetical protein
MSENQNDAKQEYPVYNFAQRVDGAKAIITELTEAGIKAELIAEPSDRDPKYDKVRVRVLAKDGTPVAHLGVNKRGFVDLMYRFTSGDQKVTGRALILVAGLTERDVSEKYTTACLDEASIPKKGGSFLDRLNQPGA